MMCTAVAPQLQANPATMLQDAFRKEDSCSQETVVAHLEVKDQTVIEIWQDECQYHEILERQLSQFESDEWGPQS